MDLLLLHAAVTWALVGLIWTIQVVHYPLFDAVGPDEQPTYQAAHMRRITWIVAPAMLVELVTGLGIALEPPAGVDPALATLAFALLLGIWLSTALVQGPAHQRLAKRPSPELRRFLVLSNWLRTALWTARGGLVVWMLAAARPAAAPLAGA